MIQNNITRAEELRKITDSVEKLIDKEIQEIEEEDRYWQQQADIKKESA